jgi:hypothetical protein
LNSGVTPAKFVIAKQAWHREIVARHHAYVLFTFYCIGDGADRNESADARSGGDHFAVDDDWAGGVAALVGFGLPAHFTGAGIESDDLAVGRGVEQDVLIDGE